MTIAVAYRPDVQSQSLMEWVLRIMANLLRPDELGPAEAAYRAVAAIARGPRARTRLGATWCRGRSRPQAWWPTRGRTRRAGGRSGGGRRPRRVRRAERPGCDAVVPGALWRRQPQRVGDVGVEAGCDELHERAIALVGDHRIGGRPAGMSVNATSSPWSGLGSPSPGRTTTRTTAAAALASATAAHTEQPTHATLGCDTGDDAVAELGRRLLVAVDRRVRVRGERHRRDREQRVGLAPAGGAGRQVGPQDGFPVRRDLGHQPASQVGLPLVARDGVVSHRATPRPRARCAWLGCRSTRGS